MRGGGVHREEAHDVLDEPLLVVKHRGEYRGSAHHHHSSGVASFHGREVSGIKHVIVMEDVEDILQRNATSID